MPIRHYYYIIQTGTHTHWHTHQRTYSTEHRSAHTHEDLIRWGCVRVYGPSSRTHIVREMRARYATR